MEVEDSLLMVRIIFSIFRWELRVLFKLFDVERKVQFVVDDYSRVNIAFVVLWS